METFGWGKNLEAEKTKRSYGTKIKFDGIFSIDRMLLTEQKNACDDSFVPWGRRLVGEKLGSKKTKRSYGTKIKFDGIFSTDRMFLTEQKNACDDDSFVLWRHLVGENNTITRMHFVPWGRFVGRK